MGAKTTDDPTRAGPPLVPEGLVIDDDLTVGSLIGQGGMAQVFRAHQSGLDREVALKITRPIRDRDRERFLLEARSLGRLKHPNAVAAHTAGCFEHDDKDFWYISMELVVGATLKQRLEEEGALPVPVVLNVVEDIAGALQEAHELGIIHRDLKPSNVMLEDESAGGHARVLDFGVAKLLGNDAVITTDSEVLGSPRYMSPEHFQQDEIDQRSDIYSLGLIMFEMLTGKHPLGKKVSLSDMMEWLRRPEIPTPELNDLEPAVARFVRRCLRREPGERFENMEALIKVLQTLRTPPPAKTRRRWLGGVALAGCAGVGAVVLAKFGMGGDTADAPVMDTGQGEAFVLLTPRTDAFWTSSAVFASAAAIALGKRLLVFDAHDDGQAMIRQARAALAFDPRALISQDFIGHGRDIERIAQDHGTDFFAINNRFDEGVPSAVATLRPDDEATGYDLARSLIEAVHRQAPGIERIHVVAVQGTDGEYATDERRTGLQRALAEHNDFDIVARVESGFTNQDEARDGVRRALQEIPEDGPIVIWCATDTMALGAIQGAILAGREPGRDVLIGGVDWTRAGLLAIQDGTLHVSYGGHFMEAGFAIIIADAALPHMDRFQLSSPMRPATRQNVEEVLGLFRTGAFERINFRELVRQVRAGRAEAVLDPAAMLSAH